MKKNILCIVMGGGCGQLESASGVLRAMDEAGIVPDKYMGASAGACITGLHSSGVTGQQITDLIKATPVDQLFKFSTMGLFRQLIGMSQQYLYNSDGIYELLKKYMTSDAERKTTVAITQYKTYEPYMVAATPVTVLASAAIPQIFRPVRIGDKLYVDGGVKNMIPTPKIGDIPSYQHIYIILCPQSSSSLQPKGVAGKAAKSLMQTMDREITQIHEDGWDQLDNVTVFYPPTAQNVPLLGWSDNFELNTNAYEYAKKVLATSK